MQLFFLAMCVTSSAADFSAPCQGKDEIDGYATRVDGGLKQMKKRTFEQTGPQLSTWHEVKTLSPEKGSMATVYLDGQGDPITAFFTIQTESGDWVLFAEYYFRPDGSLAKSKSRLNTFYGDLSVIREARFGCHGEVLGRTTLYLDLDTQKPKGARLDVL